MFRWHYILLRLFLAKLLLVYKLVLLSLIVFIHLEKSVLLGGKNLNEDPRSHFCFI